MTYHVAEAARSAAILAPDLGRNLLAEARVTSPGGSSLPGSWYRPGFLSEPGPAS